MHERLMNPTAEDASGHALMLSASIMAHNHRNHGKMEMRIPDSATANLNILLAKSPLNNRSGEVTPIMALHMITADKRFPLLSHQDFLELQKTLKTKSRCYG